MMIKRVLAMVVLTGSLGVGTLQAEIGERQPAEFPPPTYKGKQYVDSQGCVYIRAGIDGDVSWVPRVDRARKVICGFKPSLAAQADATPVAAPEPAPVQITQQDAAAAAPQVVQVAPEPVQQTAPQPVQRAARKQAVTAAPKPVAPRRVATPKQYAPAQPVTSQFTQHTRIVPKHVAYNRMNTRHAAVPRGYKRVWDDGRLNPYRAEQTLAGRNDMLLVWTQTVPRRLIDTRTGRDVTRSVPLIYPYIDIITQSEAMGKVTIVEQDGQVTKRIIRNGSARKPVYSSRSAAKAEPANKPAGAAPRALAGKTFVQVGTFGNPANAQRSARKIAQMGYPARIGKHRKNGRSYLTVQAGPFVDAGALNAAVHRLRSAGYQDAFVRK